MTRSTKRLKKAVSMPCQLVRYPAIRPATYPPIRYEEKIPMTTGIAGATSLLPMFAPASTPATAGATSAIAPIVAIQPPSTDIHEVLGRTRTPLTITLLKEKVGGDRAQRWPARRRAAG